MCRLLFKSTIDRYFGLKNPSLLPCCLKKSTTGSSEKRLSLCIPKLTNFRAKMQTSSAFSTTDPRSRPAYKLNSAIAFHTFPRSDSLEAQVCNFLCNEMCRISVETSLPGRPSVWQPVGHRFRCGVVWLIRVRHACIEISDLLICRSYMWP